MPFRKVHPKKVSAIAAEQIIEAIRDGSFAIGAKLPSEFELADRMGLSRPSIREALSALQAVGLIESRPGSGNYVLKSPSSNEEENAPLLIESEAGCLEVMEAREALEPPVAALVAQKVTPGKIINLKEAISEMRIQAQSGDFTSYIKADKKFHLALVDAVENKLIICALVPLINTIDQKIYRKFTNHYYLKDSTDLERVVDLHGEILRAIIREKPDIAYERMCEHWRRMREIWEA
jgi:GntR family transcriptional repressor for pyruvate dehydrogenase complex